MQPCSQTIMAYPAIFFCLSSSGSWGLVYIPACQMVHKTSLTQTLIKQKREREIIQLEYEVHENPEQKFN